MPYSRMARFQHRYKLRHSEEKPIITQETSGSRFWKKQEENTLRKHWPQARSIAEIRHILPQYTPSQIGSKAGHLGLKRLFNGNDVVPFAGHKELVDQIRIRSKQDGIALYKLDKTLKSGQYFGGAKWKRNKINLLYVARAIEFFGTLVIDWCDR